MIVLYVEREFFARFVKKFHTPHLIPISPTGRKWPGKLSAGKGVGEAYREITKIWMPLIVEFV